ncbi:MAG: type I restriction enzyme HsdR N-terminal domain-containing protein, partial [SAR324 cluster bacterium]|nr:type I restriction enzyme HsdR N-terminal domain-containing protein [SAR324 cluster bacterium]
MSKNLNTESEKTIKAGYLLDYISGDQIKETKKELVQQRIVRALMHEYGISPDDMARDFKVDGRKKADVAIFHSGMDHLIENVSRIVLCRPEPNVGKTTVRIRDYDQAAADLEALEELLQKVDSCQYGLWTNGLEFFFLEKEQKRFEVKCNPIGDWPMAEESIG